MTISVPIASVKVIKVPLTLLIVGLEINLIKICFSLQSYFYEFENFGDELMLHFTRQFLISIANDEKGERWLNHWVRGAI